MKRIRNLLGALGLAPAVAAVALLAACGGTPNPVLLLQVSNIPQGVVHISVDVTVPTSVAVGHAIFSRDSSNAIIAGRVTGQMPPGPANPNATLAIELPAGTTGPCSAFVQAETLPAGAQPGSMPMPMPSMWACAKVSVVDGQINMVTAPLTATQTPCL